MCVPHGKTLFCSSSLNARNTSAAKYAEGTLVPRLPNAQAQVELSSTSCMPRSFVRKFLHERPEPVEVELQLRNARPGQFAVYPDQGGSFPGRRGEERQNWERHVFLHVLCCAHLGSTISGARMDRCLAASTRCCPSFHVVLVPGDLPRSLPSRARPCAQTIKQRSSPFKVYETSSGQTSKEALELHQPAVPQPAAREQARVQAP